MENKKSSPKHSTGEKKHSHKIRDAALDILDDLLGQLHDSDAIDTEMPEEFQDQLLNLEAQQENEISPTGLAVEQALEVVLNEARRRESLKRKKQRKKAQAFIIAHLNENKKAGWKEISAQTTNYTSEEIKKAIIALRNKGIIKRIDGGGRGVLGVYSIVKLI